MVQASNVNEELVLNLFASMSAKDLAKAESYLHDEITWTLMLADVPGSGPHRGREAVVKNILTGGQDIFREGDPKVHVDSIVSSGDFVMAETHGSGSRVDGLPYKNTYAWALELRDGQVYKVREYMDSLYVSKFFDLGTAAPTRG